MTIDKSIKLKFLKTRVNNHTVYLILSAVFTQFCCFSGHLILIIRENANEEIMVKKLGGDIDSPKHNYSYIPNHYIVQRTSPVLFVLSFA